MLRVAPDDVAAEAWLALQAERLQGEEGAPTPRRDVTELRGSPIVEYVVAQTLFERAMRAVGQEEDPTPLLLAVRERLVPIAGEAAPFPAVDALLGYTYLDRDEDRAPGIAALERAHAKAPSDVDVLFALGILFAQDGRIEDAIRPLRLAARWSPRKETRAQARELLKTIGIRVR